MMVGLGKQTSRRSYGARFLSPLKEDDYIAKFHIDNGTLEWPNGADLAPEFLYELVEKNKPELSEK